MGKTKRMNERSRKDISETYEDYLMEKRSEASDEIALKRNEETYRACLKNDPGNHEARAALARCLFLQWASRTAMTSQENPDEEVTVMSAPGDVLQRGMQELEVSRVLAECLHHALTTYQLSPNAGHRAEMKRMQTLVYRAGRQGAISKAKIKMARAAACLMQEMLLEPDIEIQGQSAELPDYLENAPDYSVFISHHNTAH